MKNLIYNFLLCCVCLAVTSCNREVTVSGTAVKAKEMLLYSFNKGELSLMQRDTVDKENGSFGFSVQLPYEGLYLIGANEDVLYPLYLKKGESIVAAFKDNRFTLSGETSLENDALFKWENRANDVKIHSFLYNWLPGDNSAKYGKFFEELEQTAAFRDSLLNDIKGEKGKFYTFLANKINADLDFYALNYLRFNGWSIPDSVALPSYYANMSPDEIFQASSIVELPYAGKMLETYVWYLNKDNAATNGKNKVYPFGSLREKTLQQEYLLSVAGQMKFYNEYANMIEQTGKDFFTEPYALRMARIESGLEWSKPGLPAPDFKAMAPDSSWMSLSDYRGKCVVIDVWATWCEPCRRMMPIFHELQKDFRGKDVEFLSVCVGVWVESDKWLSLSKEFGIEKNNFFVTGWNSDFVKDYRISGVPRYMIIDKLGNIVNLDAPNPTTSRLKELILLTLESQN